MRRRHYLTISAAALALLVWAGAASALIVPKRSIAGIELGMTRPEVRAEKGDPLRVRHRKNEFGKYTVFHYRKLTVIFQGNGGATNVATTRRRQYTAERIHVGSTETKLRAAYPGVHCRTETAHLRHCWSGKLLPGHRVTDYRIGILSGRVKRISVGFVID